MTFTSPLRVVLALAGLSVLASFVAAAPEPPPIISAEEIARQLSPPPPGKTKKIGYEPVDGDVAPLSLRLPFTPSRAASRYGPSSSSSTPIG